MMADHSVARCQWHTQFDDQNNAVSLQDAISQWSNQIMPGILSRFLDKHCPQSQIWRIEQLELDLGKLELEYLDEQLPLRLSQALEESLAKLFRQQKVQFSSAQQPHVAILDKNKSGIDIVHWYLVHGSRPWWDASDISPLEVLDTQMQQRPNAILKLLQNVGQKQKVRQRIVRQWGETRIRQTVQLLEPWNTDFIFNFVENLTLTREQKPESAEQEPTTTQTLPSDSGFKQHLWYWVLTHLIVERSSVFGARQFVRSTIWQMAQHYQIDYESLVIKLTNTSEALQQRGLVAPTFVQSLQYLRSQVTDKTKTNTTDSNTKKQANRHNSQTVKQPPQREPTEAYWQILDDRLTSRTGNLPDPQGRQLSLSELLTRLGQLNNTRLFLLLKKHMASASFIKYLSTNLDSQTMNWLVRKLAPDDEEFLLYYLNYSENKFKPLLPETSGAWQSIVTHLLQSLSASGKPQRLSHRQLIMSSLQQISSTTSLQYSKLLALLNPPRIPSTGNSSFQLFSILHTLKEEAQNETEDNPAISHSRSTNNDSLSETQDLEELTHWHKNRRQAGDDPQQLAQKLLLRLDQTGRLSASELRQLFRALLPGGENNAVEFLNLLINHFQNGKLPSLNGQDFGFELSLVFVKALLESQSSAKNTWPALVMAELARQMAVPENLLNQHLAQQLKVARQNGHISASASNWLQSALHSLEAAELFQGDESEETAKHTSVAIDPSVYQTLPEIFALADKSGSERDQEIAVILSKLLQNGSFTWLENHLKSQTKILNQVMTRLQNLLRSMNATRQRQYLELLYAGLFGKTYKVQAWDLATLEQAVFVRVKQQIEKLLSGKNLERIHNASARQMQQQAPLIWLIWQQVITQINAPQLLQTLADNPQGQLWLNAMLPAQWHGSQRNNLINGMQKLLAAALSLLPAQAKSIFMMTASPTDKQVTTQLEELFWQRLVKEWQSHLRGGQRLTGLFGGEQLQAIWLTELIFAWAQYQQVQARALISCLQEVVADTEIAQHFTSASHASLKQHLKQLAEANQKTTKVPYVSQHDHDANTRETKAEKTYQSLQQSQQQGAQLIQDSGGAYLHHSDFESALKHWLDKGLLPANINPESFSIPQMWADILRHQPQWIVEQVASVFTGKTSHSQVRARFGQFVNLSQVLDALSHLKLLTDAEARSFHQIQLLLARLPLTGISWQERQQWAQEILIQAWLTQNRDSLAPESLLQQLLWQILQSKSLTRTQLINALKQTDFQGSPALQLALDDSLLLLETPDALPNKSQQKIAEQNALEAEHQYELQQDDEAPLSFPIAINNAGVVLIQSFIKPLFERLLLLEKEQFISPQKQLAAVHYLQFLITGRSHTEEHHLLLNKILCGLTSSHPVEAGVDITDEEKDTVHSLITAVTNYWSAIGNTSIDGFRGNWMVRDGTLTETQDRWDLIVEKRAYDVLLTRAPMTWSIINLPWMKKPIYVTWPT